MRELHGCRGTCAVCGPSMPLHRWRRLSRLAADLFLDCVQSADSCQRLGGDGRCVNCMDVVELAPCVGPACHFIDGAVAVKMMKAGIRIGLQRALEVLQMQPRMLALAIFRVCEPDGGSGV